MHVKYFYPFGYFWPVQWGADTVAVSHLDYFHELGWTAEVITTDLSSLGRSEKAFRARFPWVTSFTTIDVDQVPVTLRDQLFTYDRAADRRRTREAFARPADLYVTNYVFTAPLTRLLPTGCKRVVETIDVFADQIRLHSLERLLTHQIPAPTLVDLQREYLLGIELDLYRLFDATIMISREELETVTRAGATNVHYVPRFAAQRGPVGTDPDPLYDLLFVGSDIRPNVEGMNWFYRQVYVPYLWPRGVRLGIAGRICEAVDFADQHVTRLGIVKGSLDPVYAAASIVVAPVFEGTGISIKSVEALGMGKAMVAAPTAVRGIPPDRDAFVLIDMKADPRRTAETILGLLADSARRQALERAAAEYARREFGREAFVAAMDRVVRSVGIEPRAARAA
jgi:glycosyltransferase involved in cell wall biosynthesis